MPIEKDAPTNVDSLSGLTVEQAKAVLDALALPAKAKAEELTARRLEKAKWGGAGGG